LRRNAERVITVVRGMVQVRLAIHFSVSIGGIEFHARIVVNEATSFQIFAQVIESDPFN
jgi:hypothetical protein